MPKIGERYLGHNFFTPFIVEITAINDLYIYVIIVDPLKSVHRKNYNSEYFPRRFKKDANQKDWYFTLLPNQNKIN